MTQLEQKIYDILIGEVEYSEGAENSVRELWDKHGDEFRIIYESKAKQVAKLFDESGDMGNGDD